MSKDTSSALQSFDSSYLQTYLPIYYKRFYPFRPMFMWLNYGGMKNLNFTKREFSFTLFGDIYLRYQSFKDGQNLEKETINKLPIKIDIGAIYTHDTRNRHMVHPASAFHPVQRELVFDIDMTDYDQVRFCCQGADVCNDCWLLMKIAVEILQRSLTEDFGFEHILWVFSGRRGIHAWVCDESARKLDAQQRSAVGEYLSLIKGGDQVRQVNITENRMHSSIRKAINIVENHFDEYLTSQDLLGDEKKQDMFLKLLPDFLRNDVKESFEKSENSLSKWNEFKKLVNISKKNNAKYKQIAYLIEEIQLHYCYPRLDIAVTKGLNHLLKAPFCVHPKTGKICVPFYPTDIVYPDKVPTLNKLMDELNSIENSNKKAFRLSSLKHSMGIFDNFLKKLQKSRNGQNISDLEIDDDW